MVVSTEACLSASMSKIESSSICLLLCDQDIIAEGVTLSSGQQQSLGGATASEQSSLQQKWRLFKLSNPMPCSAKFPPPPPQRSDPYAICAPTSFTAGSPGCNLGLLTPAFICINMLWSAPRTHLSIALGVSLRRESFPRIHRPWPSFREVSTHQARGIRNT